MHTHELLFELSHPIRYDILKLLVDTPLRLTKIGEKVDANNPEVSRHLDRLKNAKIVAKNVDGYYSATSFGLIIFGLMPAISFIAGHPDFFTEHDLSLLPPEFMSRLGELESCEVIEGMLVNIYRLDEISKSSKSRIFTVSNEFVSKIKEEDLAEADQFFAGGAEFRYILQETQLEDENLMKVANHFGPSRNEHFRVIPQVPLFCSIIDDEVMLAFLDKAGKVDFSVAFCSKDPKVLRWCGDLLDYLWSRGKLLTEFE